MSSDIDAYAQTTTGYPLQSTSNFQPPQYQPPPPMPYLPPSSYAPQYYQQPIYAPATHLMQNATFPVQDFAGLHQQFYPPQPMHHYYPSPVAPVRPEMPVQVNPAYFQAQPNPSMYQNSDFNRPNQQSLPLPLPARFDPYRPQPVGAYDIPRSSSGLVNSQHLYRPDASLGTHPARLSSSSAHTMNNDQNQFVPFLSSSSFANLSINSLIHQ